MQFRVVLVQFVLNSLVVGVPQHAEGEHRGQLGNDGLDEIASEVGKTVRSVRAKLVREGIYVAPDKTTTRKDGPTKKELLRELEIAVGENIDVTNFMGATKQGIQFLVNTLRD